MVPPQLNYCKSVCTGSVPRLFSIKEQSWHEWVISSYRQAGQETELIIIVWEANYGSGLMSGLWVKSMVRACGMIQGTYCNKLLLVLKVKPSGRVYWFITLYYTGCWSRKQQTLWCYIHIKLISLFTGHLCEIITRSGLICCGGYSNSCAPRAGQDEGPHQKFLKVSWPGFSW